MSQRDFSFEVVKTALLKLSEDDYAGVYIYSKDNDTLEILKDINSEHYHAILQIIHCLNRTMLVMCMTEKEIHILHL